MDAPKGEGGGADEHKDLGARGREAGILDRGEIERHVALVYLPGVADQHLDGEGVLRKRRGVDRAVEHGTGEGGLDGAYFFKQLRRHKAGRKEALIEIPHRSAEEDRVGEEFLARIEGGSHRLSPFHEDPRRRGAVAYRAAEFLERLFQFRGEHHGRACGVIAAAHMVLHEHRGGHEGRRLLERGVGIGRGELVEELEDFLVLDPFLNYGEGVFREKAEEPRLIDRVPEKALEQLRIRGLRGREEDGIGGDDGVVQLLEVPIEGPYLVDGVGEEPLQLLEEALPLGPEHDRDAVVAQAVHRLVAVDVEGLLELVHDEAVRVEAPLAESEEHGGPEVDGAASPPEGAAGAAGLAVALEDEDREAPFRQEGRRREASEPRPDH